MTYISIDYKTITHIKLFIKNERNYKNGDYHRSGSTLIKKQNNVVEVIVQSRPMLKLDVKAYNIDFVQINFTSAVALRRLEAIRSYFNWNFESVFKDGMPYLVVDGELKKLEKFRFYGLNELLELSGNLEDDHAS